MLTIVDYLFPYGYSFFLFAFPATLAYNFLSHFVSNYTISTSSLNPILVPASPLGITIVPGLLFDLLVKIPLIISDTLVALVIYRLVIKAFSDHNTAIFASMLWFLNPFVIWVSSGWGMFDTFPALFTLLAVYFAIQNKYWQSGLGLVVAFAMKYYAIVLVPILLIFIWKKGHAKALSRTLVAMIATGVGLFGFTLSEISTNMTPLITRSYPTIGLTYSGLSIWTAFTFFINNFNPVLFSVSILVILFIILYIRNWMRGATDVLFLVVSFTIAISFLLLFYSNVAENYFVWVLPLISILTAVRIVNKKQYWAITAIPFLSSITNALLPFYMLPVSPWLGDYLVKSLEIASPYRIARTGQIASTLSPGKIFLPMLSILMFIIVALIIHSCVNYRSKLGRLAENKWSE